MKYISILAVIILSTIFFVAFKEKMGSMNYSTQIAGPTLFETNCAACHGLEAPADGVRLAPPVSMVKSHYMSSYPDKKEFITNVSSWVVAPDAEKSIMPGAVRRFEVMPPLPLKSSELETIAGYVYDTAFGDPVCNEENCNHGDGQQCKQMGKGGKKQRGRQ